MATWKLQMELFGAICKLKAAMWTLQMAMWKLKSEMKMCYLQSKELETKQKKGLKMCISHCK